MCGLKIDERIERETGWVSVREANETVVGIGAGHAIAHGGQLLRDGAMTDDHTGDSFGMISANEEAAGSRHNIR